MYLVVEYFSCLDAVSYLAKYRCMVQLRRTVAARIQILNCFI
jgi:hypothetical protein